MCSYVSSQIGHGQCNASFRRLDCIMCVPVVSWFLCFERQKVNDIIIILFIVSLLACFSLRGDASVTRLGFDRDSDSIASDKKAFSYADSNRGCLIQSQE